RATRGNETKRVPPEVDDLDVLLVWGEVRDRGRGCHALCRDATPARQRGQGERPEGDRQGSHERQRAEPAVADAPLTQSLLLLPRVQIGLGLLGDDLEDL